MIPQQQAVSSAGSWTGDLNQSGSALQSDALYPAVPPSQPRLGSVDERLKNMDLSWNPDLEPAQILQFGGHRVDVRDARHRLHEAASFQTPRYVPAYQLYHPNLSGPLIQDGNRVYAPAPAIEVYGTRTRSGSSPPQPDGLGIEFP